MQTAGAAFKVCFERFPAACQYSVNWISFSSHLALRAGHVVLDVKVAAPNTALRVLDNAIQVHGAGGVSSDFPLSHLWASARTLRIADGPDEVHLGTIAKLELQRVSKL